MVDDVVFGRCVIEDGVNTTFECVKIFEEIMIVDEEILFKGVDEMFVVFANSSEGLVDVEKVEEREGRLRFVYVREEIGEIVGVHD